MASINCKKCVFASLRCLEWTSTLAHQLLILEFEFIGEGAGEACAIRFNVQFVDLAVFDDHGEALGAVATERRQVDAEVQGLDESAGGVGQHADLWMKLRV